MKFKILLIGGTGVISSEIMLLSIKKGYEIHLLNRGMSVHYLPSEVLLHKADVRNREAVKEVIGDLNFDVVVDFISYTIGHLENTFTLFSDRCKQFIFISSACVYNRENQDEVLVENSKLFNYNWDYGINKLKCEEYLKKQATEKKIEYTIVRPYITYGDTRIPFGIMPSYGYHWTLVSRILAEKPIFVWGDGKTRVAITHASDFAKGFVGLLMNEKAFGQIFHITSDETTTWNEVLNLVGEKVGKKVDIIHIPTSEIIKYYPSVKSMILGDRSLNAVFDNSKIKGAVDDFKCVVSIKQGVENTINTIKEQKYQKGIDFGWEAITDKVIANHLKKNREQNKKIGFVDYMNNNLFSDRCKYFLYRYFPEKYVALYYKLVSKFGC